MQVGDALATQTNQMLHHEIRIDIAIDVKNIDALFEEVKAKAIEAEKVATEKQATPLFRMLDTQVNGLPFWEKGVKFFTIEGPNKEKIEFCERL